MFLKKIIFSVVAFILIIVIVVLSILNTQKKTSDLTKVKVAEVTHSMFYAPQYLAHKLGYFEEEGLDVEIITVPGADKVTAAVLSGDVQIGFCGSESTIYVYNQGEKDYLVNFAALTKRDGSFIVSREKIEDFTLEDLKGKHVVAGRQGGMPVMMFEWALTQAGIDPKEDVNVDTSIEFASMSGAFIGGTGDFVNLFEPNALQLEQEGYGYVVASLGELGGVVPYTAYHAKKSYIEENEEVIQGFSNAINKALKYTREHTPEEIAKDLVDYFPDTSLDDITTIVKRYKDNDSWFETTEIKEEDFNHIQEVMENSEALEKRAPYDKLVDTRFVK
ncbi:MAG TPA: ABC transporter substrate-binding protein [Candidatus Pelethosoma merdigallinarum]|nr:ABC transporter substrate-binding protein [Candidatus Pelethosoma merdigallinarum]